MYRNVPVLGVLTFKSVETILEVGGTQSWALDRNRAKNCRYVVVCRNQRHPDVEGHEEHGHAFMIGKVKDVVPSTEAPDRWLVTFSEYAVGDFGDEWKGRNPVAYYMTSDYQPDKGDDYDGIYFSSLDSKPMPEPLQEEVGISRVMTVAEAKAALVAALRVDASHVEITVRL